MSESSLSSSSPVRPAQAKRGADIVVDIADLAAGGAGVARLDGYVVFVHGGLPGDRVRARIDRARAAYAEATAVEIVAPGDARQASPCAHFGTCGGCNWLALDIAAQRDVKARHVREQLQRLGGVRDVEVLPTLASPRTFHYRNKMEYSFFAGDDGPVLGLHVRGRFDRVFSLNECMLASEDSVRLAHAAVRLARRDGIPAYHQRRHTGVLRVLATRESRTSGAILAHLVAARDLPAFDRWVEPLREACPSLAGFVVTTNDTASGISTVGASRVAWGTDRFLETLGGMTFDVHVKAFFQVNVEQAEQLAQCVLDRAALRGDERVLDLYCGTGTLALLLARNAREVIGVEASPEALADARRNAERNGVASCRFLHGAVEDLPIASLRPVDLVVIDPPRAGMHPRALESVAALEAPRLVYVSCNPATLARDLAAFAERGYRAGAVQPIDMFPHTAHVEAVVALQRESQK